MNQGSNFHLKCQEYIVLIPIITAVVMETFHFKITAPHSVKCVSITCCIHSHTPPHSLTIFFICFQPLPFEKWPSWVLLMVPRWTNAVTFLLIQLKICVEYILLSHDSEYRVEQGKNSHSKRNPCSMRSIKTCKYLGFKSVCCVLMPV